MIVILEAILSTVADAPESRGGIRRDFAVFKFSLFCAFAVARVTRNRGEWSCSRISIVCSCAHFLSAADVLPARLRSRVRGCAHVHPSLNVILQLTQNLHRRALRRNNVDLYLKFYRWYKLIALPMRCSRRCERSVLNSGTFLRLSPSFSSIIENLKQFHLHTKALWSCQSQQCCTSLA